MSTQISINPVNSLQNGNASPAISDWRFCVAPMIDITDRHCRYFFRLLSPHVRLYTEMITCKAIIHGDRDHLLGFDELEHPLALQLAGNDPKEFAFAAKQAQLFGYDEINLNIGCPSDRVQSGEFGACLMTKPKLVAECVSAIKEAVNLPVTIKTRIGINDGENDYDSFDFLNSLVESCNQAGANTFIIHARKAFLKGLSPKENRSIPPINYPRVKELKLHHPELSIIVNGAIETIKECEQHLLDFDGVMLGREIYKNPYLLTEVNQTLFNDNARIKSRSEIVAEMLPYLEQQLKNGSNLKSLSRHLAGLFFGQANGKHWRRFVNEDANIRNNSTDALLACALEIDKLAAA